MSLSPSQTAALVALEGYVADEQQQLRRAIRRNTVIYVALAVLVFCYTVFVMSKLRAMTSREALAEYTQAFLKDSLEEARNNVFQKYDEHSDLWSQQVVQQGITQLPDVERALGMQLDAWADELAASVEESLATDFVKFLRDNGSSVRSQYQALSDEEVAKGLALICADLTEEALDRQANQELVDSTGSLEVALYTVSKPRQGLTRRQDAVRRLVAYNAFLADHKRVHLEVVNRFVESFTNTVREEWQLDFMDQLQIEALLNVKEVMPSAPVPAPVAPSAPSATVPAAAPGRAASR